MYLVHEWLIVALASTFFGFVVVRCVQLLIARINSQKSQKIREAAAIDQYTPELWAKPEIREIDFGDSMPAHKAPRFQSSKY